MQMLRLSSTTSHGSPNIPEIIVSPSQGHLSDDSNDPAASWSLTAAEASTTESSLLPFLVHLAVARDDVTCLDFCLNYEGRELDPLRSPVAGERLGYAGGLVNSMDPASGRFPLHVAAMNGSVKCLAILLKTGALVHLRDTLGHTALYYASSFVLYTCF